MSRNSSSKGGLGKALVRQHRNLIAETKARGSGFSKRVVESVTDVKDIDAVLEDAENAGLVFSKSNPLPTLLNLDINASEDELTPEERKLQQKEEEVLYEDCMRVPRRPPWHSEMSAEELDAREKKYFLEWRRGLARLEEIESLVITPFEKNIEMWRQLWRVLERSDLIVTVVDARNPLFYRCPDLEAYVQEIDCHKKTMLLVNKADLLPNTVRERWAKYFQSQGILYLFWSAKAASETLDDKDNKESLEILHSQGTSDDIKIYNREELLSRLQVEAEAISVARTASNEVDNEGQSKQKDSSDVESTRSNDSLHAAPGGVKRVVVGFVGYPNVGKSSTINALVGQKRTGVTSTPGKTKHFQTLIISEKLMLCDCPGLVFPSFSSSRHEMVTLGVLPIDRMTDHREAIQIVADRVPRSVLENTYRIVLPCPKPYEPRNRPPEAFELLKTYCQSRGYVASGGLPDETRAARQILKDYIHGKLVHFQLPPSDSDNANLDPAAEGVYGEDIYSSDSEEEDIERSVEPSISNATLKAETETTGQLLHVMDSSTLEGVLNDLDSFESVQNKRLGNSEKKDRMQKVRAPHKLHKKAPRKKDRSWRVGNDGGDGMPAAKAIQKPVSYGHHGIRKCQQRNLMHEEKKNIFLNGGGDSQSIEKETIHDKFTSVSQGGVVFLLHFHISLII